MCLTASLRMHRSARTTILAVVIITILSIVAIVVTTIMMTLAMKTLVPSPRHRGERIPPPLTPAIMSPLEGETVHQRQGSARTRVALPEDVSPRGKFPSPSLQQPLGQGSLQIRRQTHVRMGASRPSRRKERRGWRRKRSRRATVEEAEVRAGILSIMMPMLDAVWFLRDGFQYQQRRCLCLTRSSTQCP